MRNENANTVKAQIQSQPNADTIEIDGWVTELLSPFAGVVFDTTINKKKDRSFSKKQINTYNLDSYYLDVSEITKLKSNGSVSQIYYYYHVFSVFEDGTIAVHLFSDSRNDKWTTIFDSIQKIIKIPVSENTKLGKSVYFNLTDYAFETQYYNCSIASNSKTVEVEQILNDNSPSASVVGNSINTNNLTAFKTGKFYFNIGFSKDSSSNFFYDCTFFTVNLKGSLNIIDAVIVTEYENQNPKFTTKKQIAYKEFRERILPKYLEIKSDFERLKNPKKDLTLLILKAKAVKLKALALTIDVPNKVVEDEMQSFNFESMFEITADNYEELEEVKEESEFVKKTKECLRQAEEQLSVWENKTYKSTKGSVFVGDELSGNNYSINYINEKRKSDTIKNLKSEIKQYKRDLGFKV